MTKEFKLILATSNKDKAREIAEILSDTPFVVTTMKEEGYDPDIVEDGKTFDYNVNAYITTGVGGTAIDGEYWSATVSLMQNWHFSEFSWTGRMKSETNRLRPVLGF